MPPDKTGEGKRKLPEPKEAMETPDKKIPVPTGSSGSSARRILFSEMHQKPEECTGAVEMEEVQSKSRFCSERDVQSNAACAPGSGTHRQRARVLFGRMPGRERMNRFLESTEQQVRLSPLYIAHSASSVRSYGRDVRKCTLCDAAGSTDMPLMFRGRDGHCRWLALFRCISGL